MANETPPRVKRSTPVGSINGSYSFLFRAQLLSYFPVILAVFGAIWWLAKNQILDNQFREAGPRYTAQTAATEHALQAADMTNRIAACRGEVTDRINQVSADFSTRVLALREEMNDRMREIPAADKIRAIEQKMDLFNERQQRIMTILELLYDKNVTIKGHTDEVLP
jgi:hypothetical protein